MGSAVDAAAPRRRRRMGEGPACSQTLIQRPGGFRKGDQGGTWWRRWERFIYSTQERTVNRGWRESRAFGCLATEMKLTDRMETADFSGSGVSTTFKKRGLTFRISLGQTDRHESKGPCTRACACVRACARACKFICSVHL